MYIQLSKSVKSFSIKLIIDYNKKLVKIWKEE